MRFLGSKELSFSYIYSILKELGVEGETVFDVFSGTAFVSNFYKKLGYKVYTSDLLYFSYCLQKAYLDFEKKPSFKRLNIGTYEDVVESLNYLKPLKGFIYNNYSPGGKGEYEIRFFTKENARKIDAIRQRIEDWEKENKLEENEYYLLVASLVENVPFYANTIGKFDSFLLKWDLRALSPFFMEPLTIYEGQKGVCYWGNYKCLAVPEVDILYIDPIYNHKQLGPMYHVLETIARWDNPCVYGKYNMRNYDDTKSVFVNKKKAKLELLNLVNNYKYKYLIMSFYKDGHFSHEELMEILGEGTLFKELNYEDKKETKKQFFNETLYIKKGGRHEF